MTQQSKTVAMPRGCPNEMCNCTGDCNKIILVDKSIVDAYISATGRLPHYAIQVDTWAHLRQGALGEL